jgi:hypothetical protein
MLLLKLEWVVVVDRDSPYRLEQSTTIHPVIIMVAVVGVACGGHG